MAEKKKKKAEKGHRVPVLAFVKLHFAQHGEGAVVDPSDYVTRGQDTASGKMLTRCVETLVQQGSLHELPDGRVRVTRALIHEANEIAQNLHVLVPLETPTAA